jgi:glycosyltransferase involved in cell wall biosynthesis
MVSAIVPSPQATNGFSARVHHFLEAAAEHLEVTLLWIRLPAHAGAPEAPAGGRLRTLDAPAAPWAARGLKGALLRRLVHYPFDRLPFDCYPHSWPALRETLAEEQPDVVAFYLPYLAHLADHSPAGVPVIAVLEEGWERVVAASLEGPDWKKAMLARREKQRFKRVYRRLDRRASAVVAISADERDALATTIDRKKIAVIPHGIDTSHFTARRRSERDLDVLVVGDLRSPRNYVGALRTWEAAEKRADCAGWKWAFVGAADADLAARLRDGGALVTGVVDDVRSYYERARVVLVPAHTGSGVKTTSIQAWSMNRPLVASPIGAQGLPARLGANILVGDDSEALVAHVGSVLRDEYLAVGLADEGRRAAEGYCDLPKIARQFAQLVVDTTADALPRS